MFTELVSPILFFLLSIMIYIIIPEKEIKPFLGLGLVGGLGIALVLLLIMQNMRGYWIFKNIDVLNIKQIPVFLSATWIPVIILFAYLLSRTQKLISIIFLVLVFPLGATIIHFTFLKFKLLTYNNWNLFYTFLISLSIHLGITYFLINTRQLSKLE